MTLNSKPASLLSNNMNAGEGSFQRDPGNGERSVTPLLFDSSVGNTRPTRHLSARHHRTPLDHIFSTRRIFPGP